MLRTRPGVHVLGPPDLPAVRRLIDRDPLTNVWVDQQVRSGGLEPRWLSGEMWGYSDGRELVSACHVSADLRPVEATDDAARAFAGRARSLPHRCPAIVGPDRPVGLMWEVLEPVWGPARSVRRHQPYLATDRPARVAPDPNVRRVTIDELDLVYPSCVAMFTEEVGISPEPDGGGYRSRIAQLITAGLAFVRIDAREVVFKAEIGAVTPRACQVQGVYVPPERRGRGLAAAGMAAVVDIALREIAPAVTLYVNEHNVAARRAYDRAGFTEIGRFTTVMF